ncbi:MAG: succinyl-diaminopimelate desuccinylase [Alphaproteobacteria bacterium]|nr:succinyl-diaminopimelate desuccinylase [Alphaproteobacteria bacterium]MCB9929290.1 succinyl-diaminopimelate desuccinylase [Alphaproteobacteria bacterium]
MRYATDPVQILQDLIRCPSVTPVDEGALGVLERALEPMGFACERMPFSTPGTPDVDNLYARLGSDAPPLCFAGHTDVVPPGNPDDWSHPPFAADIVGSDGNKVMIGRGAVDMKGAIAAFIAAVGRYLEEKGPPANGSIAFLITGDEEGPAHNGTKRMLTKLADRSEKLGACIVGEPTNPNHLGEMLKIGRRGSLSGILRVDGVQGHVAYPAQAKNPIHPLVRMLNEITAEPLDEGSDHFQPTSLQLTSVDVGNPTHNLIPAKAKAHFNVRFNDLHTSADVEAWVRERLDRVDFPYDLEVMVSGESFLTPPGPLSDLVASAAKAETNRDPDLSTTGGTSDARFIKDYCPVIEFGLISEWAHKVDEQVRLDELEGLTRIYRRFLDTWFARA